MKLLNSISESWNSYKKLEEEKSKAVSDLSEDKKNRKVTIYKRRTSQIVSKELSETEKQLAAAEKTDLRNALQEKKTGIRKQTKNVTIGTRKWFNNWFDVY